MVKFIKFLQLCFFTLFAVMVGYDFFLQGFGILTERYVLLSGAFLLLLELALLVIVKLIQDDV
ncbi:hypothetical protein ACXJY6_12465 [Vibrio sp. RC27]